MVLDGDNILPNVVVACISARAMSNWAVEHGALALAVHGKGRWWCWGELAGTPVWSALATELLRV